MLSLKKLFGKDEKFYDLLEASAEQALTSTQLLASYLQRSQSFTSANDLDEFIQSRRKDKRITQQITEELCKTFVTPLEREDIEALSLALYRIPKIVEKLVEVVGRCKCLAALEGAGQQFGAGERFFRAGFEKVVELLVFTEEFFEREHG